MSEKKKIAIVAHGLNDGGAERVATIVANYFVENNYDVLYIAAYNQEREYYVDEKIQLKFIKTNAKNRGVRLLDRNKQIYKALKQFAPDMVYSFITNELFLSVITGIPIIFSLRNDPAHIDNSKLAAVLRNYCYSHAKKIVFQTQGAKDFFNEKIKAKGVVISNPLNTKDLPLWLEHEHKKTFITACRLNAQKNLPMLINAFVKLHKEAMDYSLEIYGDGKLKDELEALIKEKDADSYIFLKGHTKEIHKIMSESFAFVLSSDFEGLSNSMLEALAIGIPCICTDCPPGGARAYIKDGENGLLTEVGNSHIMYEKMKYLVEHTEQAAFYSQNAIKLKDELDTTHICMLWENLIN